MRYLHWTNPRKVWTRETIFEKKLKKMSGILRQWPLSLHRKTAKLLNMAPILPILKVLQNKKKIFCQYSIGGHILFYNFCCKMETVGFF